MFSAEKSQEGRPQGFGDDPPHAPDDENRAAGEYHKLDRDDGGMGSPRGLARGSARQILKIPIMPCLTHLVAGRRPVPTKTVADSLVSCRQGGVSRA